MRKNISVWLIVGALAALAQGPASAQWLQIQKETSPSSQASDFGQSVAMDGDLALVGDHMESFGVGAAYVYQRNSSGIWIHIATLQPPTANNTENFGWSVALDATTSSCHAIVGAFRANGFEGAAYLYDCSDWSQAQKITASDAQIGDSFGSSVSISGTRALIGAFGNDGGGVSNAGAAYVFELGSGGLWQQTAKLVSNPPDSASNFGHSASLAGTRAAVGANTGGSSNQGAVYVFDLINSTWVQQAHLTVPSAGTLDQLGFSVSVSGNYVLAGAIHHEGTGSAFSFRRDSVLGWVLDTKIKAFDAQSGDQFGVSVHLLGSWAVIGASAEDEGGFGAGAAYVFERDACGLWKHRGKIIADDPSSSAFLGRSVQMGSRTEASDTPLSVPRLFLTVLTGAPGAGAAYWFEDEIPGYTQACKPRDEA
jgi:hypothetical protein